MGKNGKLGVLTCVKEMVLKIDIYVIKRLVEHGDDDYWYAEMQH